MSTPVFRAVSDRSAVVRLAARVTAITLLLVFNLLVAVTPATACSGPLMPLSTAGSGASRIVVGTVVEKTTTRPYELVLAVERVVKGKAPGTLRISELLATHVCGDPIDAEPGQRLVVAFDVRSYSQTLNPAAIFDGEGRLVFSWFELPNQNWTMDDLITALSMPSTDASPTVWAGQSGEPSGQGLVPVAAFVATFLVALTRRRRRCNEG